MILQYPFLDPATKIHTHVQTSEPLVKIYTHIQTKNGSNLPQRSGDFFQIFREHKNIRTATSLKDNSVLDKHKPTNVPQRYSP